MTFSNTTPIIALAGIGQLDLLTRLFGEIQVVGTLGILLKAKELGLIASFHEAVARMQSHGVFYHPALVARLRALAGE